MRASQLVVQRIFARELAAEIFGRLREHGQELSLDDAERLLSDCSRTVEASVVSMPAVVLAEIDQGYSRPGFELLTIELWRTNIAPHLGHVLREAMSKWLVVS